MKRIAMIRNSVVENIAVWDGVSSWKPLGFNLVEIKENEQCDINFNYDGKLFSPSELTKGEESVTTSNAS